MKQLFALGQRLSVGSVLCAWIVGPIPQVDTHWGPKYPAGTQWAPICPSITQQLPYSGSEWRKYHPGGLPAPLSSQAALQMA